MEDELRKDNLLPNKRNRKAPVMNPKDRAEAIRHMERNLKQLVPTPLKPLKQYELWKRWRPLLPEYARDITCPKPSDEVIKSIKERTRNKGRIRTAAKKQKTVEESIVDSTSSSVCDNNNTGDQNGDVNATSSRNSTTTSKSI